LLLQISTKIIENINNLLHFSSDPVKNNHDHERSIEESNMLHVWRIFKIVDKARFCAEELHHTFSRSALNGGYNFQPFHSKN